jgi:hypothetical protein
MSFSPAELSGIAAGFSIAGPYISLLIHDFIKPKGITVSDGNQLMGIAPVPPAEAASAPAPAPEAAAVTAPEVPEPVTAPPVPVPASLTRQDLDQVSEGLDKLVAFVSKVAEALLSKPE